MVYLNPNPIAFSIGAVSVRWYGLIAALGLLLGYFLAPYIAKCVFKDNDAEIYQNAIIISAVFGIIGARILYVMLTWSYFRENPTYIIRIWDGGLSFHGGLILGLIALYAYSRIAKKNFFRITDAVAAPVAFALGFGRIGNIMNSEILGRACYHCWFNFTFADGIPRYPIQLYSFFHHMILAALIVYLMLRFRKTGVGTLAFLTFYSLFRFIVEFFRLEPVVVGGLDLAQLVSIPIILIAGYFLYKITFGKSKPKEKTSSENNKEEPIKEKDAEKESKEDFKEKDNN